MLFVLQLTLLHNLQCEARIFITPPKNLTYRFTYCHFVKKNTTLIHYFACVIKILWVAVWYILNEWKEQQVQTIYT